MCGFTSGLSFLFPWPICLFWYQYDAVLITEALYSKSEKSDTVIPPTLIFLWFLIVLVILVLLPVYINFRINLQTPHFSGESTGGRGCLVRIHTSVGDLL